jgi:glutamine---fructose-6-phosphate transaminase (isomerizing)
MSDMSRAMDHHARARGDGANRPVAADGFLAEILEQPVVLLSSAAALARQTAQLEAVHHLAQPGARFVLTGMGSSFDVCLAAASVLARRGVVATTVNTAELLHFRADALTPGTPVLAVSQSGSSIELVRLAEELGGRRSRPPLVSLTNGLANPLADLADVRLDMTAGIERGPSTKTFAACLVAMRTIIDAMTAGGSGFSAARACEEAAGDATRAAAEAGRLLADPAGLAARMDAWCGQRPSLVVLGRGTARAAAEMGALILKEAARRHAESLDTAEFRHGPLELSGPDLAAAIVSTEPATNELDAGLVAELRDHGASVLLIATRSAQAPAETRFAPDMITIGELHPMLAPAVAVIPLQLLAWRLAIESGRDPARMQRASKVTTRE